MSKDMTKGVPWKLILYFTLPVLAGNIFQQLYTMVDTMIVGRFINVDALAAVGSTGSISFLILGFAMGIASGFGIVMSQRFGAGDEEGVRRSVGTSVVLCIIITIILTVLGMTTAKPLLTLMKTPDNIIADAVLYITIIYAGIFASMYYNMIAAILRALGDSKTPLYFLILSSLVNIGLDLLLIIVFHMGVAGAAIATVFSQLFSAVLCTIYTLKKYELLHLNRHHFKLDSQSSWTHLRVGLPMAFQFSVTAVGVMILQGAMNVYGSSVIAAYTAASRVEILVTQPLSGLGTTMATYCGQNLGANRWDRIKKGMNACLIMMSSAAVIAILLNIFCGRWFTALFMEYPDETIIGYAQTYLNIIAGFYFFLGLIYVFRNALQGMGDSLIPMIGGVAEFTARMLIVLILPAFLGYVGVCFATPGAWFVTAILLLIRYIILLKKHAADIKASPLESE